MSNSMGSKEAILPNERMRKEKNNNSIMNETLIQGEINIILAEEEQRRRANAIQRLKDKGFLNTKGNLIKVKIKKEV